VSFERLRAIPEKQREEPPFAPDIAVEVRSPSDNLTFLRRKIERYLQAGSVLVLIADPDKRTIVAHDSGGVRNYGVGDRFAHPAVPCVAQADAIAAAASRSAAGQSHRKLARGIAQNVRPHAHSR
jgi:hypothetical protein